MMVEMEKVRVVVDPLGRMDRINTAKMLMNTPKTLANWATKGIGPRAFKVGGKTFYWADEVAKFGRGEA